MSRKQGIVLLALLIFFSSGYVIADLSPGVDSNFMISVDCDGKQQEITSFFELGEDTIKYKGTAYTYDEGLVIVPLSIEEQLMIHIDDKYIVKDKTGIYIKKEIGKGKEPKGIVLQRSKGLLQLTYLYISRSNNKYVITKSLNPAPMDAQKADNHLLFVNRFNPVRKAYPVQAEVPIDNKKINSNKGIRTIDKKVANALYEMTAAYPKSGLSKLLISSSIRSYSKQQALFNSRLKRNQAAKVQNPFEATHKRVALPGTSEHHTGLALDIACLRAPTDDAFAGTKESDWLRDNCYKYGFIIRYPKEKQKQTYTMYEPWHIRYVGKAHSEMLYSKKLCYEEYAEAILKAGCFLFKNSDGKRYIDLHVDSLSHFKTVKGIEVQASHFRDTQGDYIITIKLN